MGPRALAQRVPTGIEERASLGVLVRAERGQWVGPENSVSGVETFDPIPVWIKGIVDSYNLELLFSFHIHHVLLTLVASYHAPI
jgi:hypothetical protein